jgi:hypothetical protein
VSSNSKLDSPDVKYRKIAEQLRKEAEILPQLPFGISKSTLIDAAEALEDLIQQLKFRPTWKPVYRFPHKK